MTAIVALGIWRSCSHMWWYVLSSVGIGCGSVGNSRIAATSKWAMNHSGFADRSTTTRTSSSTASRSIVSASSRYTGTVIRLIGAWSTTTVAIPSCVVTTRFPMCSDGSAHPDHVSDLSQGPPE